MCVVPKHLTLYTDQMGMGKKNKVVKLTHRKIKYIIRAKTNNISTKRTAAEMKVGESTVKRVWMHLMKTKMLLNSNKFGRKKNELDEESEMLILENQQRAKFGSKASAVLNIDQIHISICCCPNNR